MVELRTSLAELLQRLSKRPDWLENVLQADQIQQALSKKIPEVVNGSVCLVGGSIDRLFLKDTSGRWTGIFKVNLENCDGSARREVKLRVTLFAPGQEVPILKTQSNPAAFNSDEWECFLPELGLLCSMEPPEKDLAGLEQLIDPVQARSLLEDSIRSGPSAYQDIQIQACRPQILNYKPGSRCTIRYELEYPQGNEAGTWPAAVIAKIYREHKGEQAYHGMLSLWHSPLATSRFVRIAEPLAYRQDRKLLLQTQLEEEQTLENLLRSVLAARTPDGMDMLQQYIRKTAAGLAMVHRSGVRASDTVTWGDRAQEIPELVERIAVFDPKLASSVQPVYQHIFGLAVSQPPDSLAPSHGSFDADQVLIAQDSIGFIDFDSFCMAEPALDVSHFCASLIDSGMKKIDPSILHDPDQCQQYINRLYAFRETFLNEYQSRAGVSTRRVILWEAMDYLRDALHLITKPKPNSQIEVSKILEYHLEHQVFAAV